MSNRLGAHLYYIQEQNQKKKNRIEPRHAFKKWLNKSTKRKGKSKKNLLWSVVKTHTHKTKRRGKKFPGVQTFPYADQKSVRLWRTTEWGVCVRVWHTHARLQRLKLAGRRERGTAWFWDQKKKTPTENGARQHDEEGGGGGAEAACYMPKMEFNLRPSVSTRPTAFAEESHLQRNKYFNRPNAAFPLNYILTLEV